MTAQLIEAVQSDDGTLWFAGSGGGLYSFDGVRLTPYEDRLGDSRMSRQMRDLVAWPNEGLWVAYLFGGMGHLKDGHWKDYGEGDGLPKGTVISIFRDQAHTVWITAPGGMARLNGDRWERVPLISADHTSFVPYQALFDQNGVLWVTSQDRVYVRSPDEDLFHEIATLSFAANAYVRTIELAPDGALWITEPSGLTRIRLHPSLSIHKYVGVQVDGALFDRDGNLWLGSLDAKIRWLAASAVKSDLTDSELQRRLVTVPVTGSSQRVFPMLEDREGNIWVKTGSLYRFSPSTITTVYRSMDVSIPPLIAADGASTLWIAAPHGPGGQLIEVQDGRIRSQQSVPKLTSHYRDRDGSVWFAGPGTVAHLIQGKIVAATALPESMAGHDVQTMVRDAGGALWLSVVREGLFRCVDGNCVENGGSSTLPANTNPIVANADADGAIWLGYTNNRVALIKRGTATLFAAPEGLDVGTVTAIQTGAHLWIGGDAGLERFDGKHFFPVLGAGGKHFRGITGIIETDSGDLWLNGSEGISHIPGAELSRSLADPAYQPNNELFNYLDGLPNIAVSVRPLPSALAAGGRLWFSLRDGYVVSIDPKHIVRNPLVPPVRIWSVIAQNKKYDADAGPIDLPIHTSSLQIQYSAGSLTVPERVRFRHRLEGLDKDWQDGGGRRDAFYTNLSPGSYTFHVIAANNDGVWNNTGASLHFTIEPAWYQTRSFVALMSLLIAGLGWWTLRWRLRATHERMRARFEERLGERERIARELHDTFLQSVQGLMLKFQSAAQKLPTSEAARHSIEQSLEHADRVLIEGRDRVSALRGIGPPRDLPRAMRAVGEEFARGSMTRFEMRIEGKERPFYPFVGDELYRIGAEALANAYRHAQAQHIELIISYGRRDVCLRICDDGEGFEPRNMFSSQAAGHWGLQGMHERASKIRAHFSIKSKPGEGTTVEVTIANSAAFRRADHAKSAAAYMS